MKTTLYLVGAACLLVGGCAGAHWGLTPVEAVEEERTVVSVAPQPTYDQCYWVIDDHRDAWDRLYRTSPVLGPGDRFTVVTTRNRLGMTQRSIKGTR